MKDIIKTKSLTKYIKNKAIKEIALFCCAFIFVVCYVNIYFFLDEIAIVVILSFIFFVNP